MPKPLDIHRLAMKEAREAFRWYLRCSEQAAYRFRANWKQALDDIEQYPQRWPEYLFGTRVRRMRKFPYLVVYRETPTYSAIVAVAHGARRPGYWKRRLR